MKDFIFFDEQTRKHFVNPRIGESKFGEKVNLISKIEELENHSGQYVIFGIPEDIGIRGNYGKPGASTTWESFLSSFLNIQANRFNNPENCILLGKVNCNDFMAAAEKLSQSKKGSEQQLGEITSQIDNIVSEVVKKIISYGKTPIIIGGGHNNAYGNIKGCSDAKNKAVNILNIDAHTDLRNTDYRHSGNGFSFAKKDGLMERYAIFGIHKNYTPEYIFKVLDKEKDYAYTLFSDLMNETTKYKGIAFEQATAFLDNSFGLEIDCDAIENFSSSALSPTGFSVNNIRTFIGLAKKKNIHYLHICEAVAQNNSQIGKALSYFVSDFIRKE